jgi:RHS repeat-associated protein
MAKPGSQQSAERSPGATSIAVESLTRTRVLPELLVPIGEPDVTQSRKLASLLSAYAANPDGGVEGLERFLSEHPSSPWSASLRANLGSVYYANGWFSKALSRWEAAWNATKESTDPSARLVADYAVGEYLRMNARLGRHEVLEPLLAEIEGRDISGPATSLVQGAREGHWLMKNRPEVAFRCGPFALGRIWELQSTGKPMPEALSLAESTSKGTSLAHNAKLAATLGMNLRPAFREPGSEVIIPSVVHWKVGHFAALVGESGGRLHIVDPTFGQNLWISREALDAEASGYFLVDGSKFTNGWRVVDDSEAGGIWGRGETHDTDDPSDCTQEDGGGGDCNGMPVYTFGSVMASLRIKDTPIGYSMPVGSGVYFSVLYDQRRRGQPSSFTFSNLGPKWSHNWMTYVEFAGSDPQTVTYHGSGGGQQVFTRRAPEANQPGTPGYAEGYFDTGYKSTSRLRFVSLSSFELEHADGSRSVFSAVEGTTPRRLFLTKSVDAQGLEIILTYDYTTGSPRLSSITDALGLVTTISYENPAQPLKITKVTDPFQRSARFEYDASGRLVAITDIIQLRSSFSYGQNDFISSMTTPYGTTRFSTNDVMPVVSLTRSGQVATATTVALHGLAAGETVTIAGAAQSQYNGEMIITGIPGPRTFTFAVPATAPSLATGSISARPKYVGKQLTRWVEAEDPMGERERIEYTHQVMLPPEPVSAIPVGMSTANAFLNYRNTFFWDKLAMREHEGDYSQATVYHWLHTPGGKTSDVLESVKRPLENRVWFNYPGQATAWHGALYTGSSKQPSMVARVLEDGSTQLTKMEYNATGGITKHVDPLGRETRFTYAANGIDLSEVLQVTGPNGATSRLARIEYGNIPHLPSKVIDATSQTTQLQYNSRGQTTRVINAKGEVIRFEYDMLGHPSFPGADYGFLRRVFDNRDNLVLSLDYNVRGLVQRVTDTEGSWVEYTYDDFDRTTTVTYMNGDTVTMEYDRLDLAKSTDRKGRSTQYMYNANRQLQAVRDPLGRLTQLEYCKCGALSTLIDPMGRATNWEYDVQGRVVSKRYADGRGEDYTYEPAAGRLKTVTDAKGQVTNFEYNTDGSIKRVFHTNAGIPTPEVAFTYDPLFPRLSQMVDGIGTTAYTYNPVNGQVGAGALQKIYGPLPNDDITFTYDELGRVTGTFIDGVGATRAFDNLGRVTSVVNPLGTFTFGYDGDLGRLLSMTSSTGHRTNYAYYGQADEHRLQTIENLGPGDALLSKFDYEYDPNGMITKWTQQAGTATPAVWNYEYDAAYQLTGAVKSVAGAITKRYYYSYDAMGNRTSEQIDNTVTTGVFNNLNQLGEIVGGGKLRVAGRVSEPSRVFAGTEEIDVTAAGEFRGAVAADDGTTMTVRAEDYSGNTSERVEQVTVQNGDRKVFAYDLNGNTTKITTYPADGSATRIMEFEWDAKDQLVAITQGDGRRSEFSYDGYGRRVRIVEKEAGSVVDDRTFVWLGFAIAEERGANGTTIEKRFLGSGEQRMGADGSTTALFYSKDHLGSIREVSDTAGTVRARYEYDPYGRRAKVEGDLDCEFGFTGHVYHGESGLHLAPFRAYDAETGRWVSRDPLREDGDVNLYGYVGGSPVHYLDTLGLSKCDSLRNVVRDLRDKINRKKETIGNLKAKIQERIGEKKENPGRLPGKHQPGMQPRDSRQGHEWLIEKDKAKLAEHEALLSVLESEIAAVGLRLTECLAKEKLEKELRDKAIEKCVKKGAKKTVKAVCTKVPIIGAGFFIYDWSQGGFGHAVDEAVWPASELWNGDK